MLPKFHKAARVKSACEIQVKPASSVPLGCGVVGGGAENCVEGVLRKDRGGGDGEGTGGTQGGGLPRGGNSLPLLALNPGGCAWSLEPCGLNLFDFTSTCLAPRAVLDRCQHAHLRWVSIGAVLAAILYLGYYNATGTANVPTEPGHKKSCKQHQC